MSQARYKARDEQANYKKPGRVRMRGIWNLDVSEKSVE